MMLMRAGRGSALVEMVVVTPLLLTLLLGIIEAGKIGDYAIGVANAARAGVQYGAQNEATAGDTRLRASKAIVPRRTACSGSK